MAVREGDLRPGGEAIPEVDPRRWKALFVLALVQFMIIIDITVVNVALPSIQRSLHFTGDSLAWVVDGYALMAGGLLLFGGRVGDLFGRKRLFLIGTVLVTGGVLALIDGFLAASHHSWGSPNVVFPLVIGVAALLAMVVVESRTRDPLIPITFFANRTRVSANVATAVMASGMFGMFFLLTLYLQQVLRYSPLETGLAYVPFGFGLVTGITISTKIIERVGARAVIATAYTIAGAGLLLLGGVTVSGNYVGDLLPTILMLSFGMGAAFPAIQIAALHQVSDEDAGLGSGVQTTVMQVGGALGLAVLVTLAVRRTASSLAAGNTAAVAATDGYALAFRIAALALFAAALGGLALVPGRKREAATERVIEDGLV